MNIAARTLAPVLSLLALPATAQEPSPGFTLSVPASSTTTTLLDSDGSTVHAWASGDLPGLSAYLDADGHLLRSLHPLGFGGDPGAGGRVQRIAWDGTLLWSYDYFTPTKQQHHDIEPLPNGNVLMIAWDVRTAAEAIAAGRNPATIATPTFLPDHIVEIQPTGPTSGAVVWEWYVWDHLVQDFDPTKANFGVVADHPELIDVNYPPVPPTTDWIHANAIAYNAELDQIVLGVRTFSEIWVIDHSTTTAEAAGHSGGAQGKGGDLLYRWGNPAAYGAGTMADQQLRLQHDVSWIPPGSPGEGNLIVFNNVAGGPGGFGPGSYSSVVELVPPVDASGAYALTPGSAYGPAAPVWEYTAPNPPDFYSFAVGGGAQRLSNGNTLITSPLQNWVFEVTPNKQLIWEQTILTTPFKARRYERYLWSDGANDVSVAAGGTVDLDLVAGVEHAGRVYVVLGSASGTDPGFDVAGVHVPLNPLDFYFTHTLKASGGPLTPALGALDAQGRADVAFALPAGLDPALAGLTLHHAFGVFDATTGVVHLSSNAEPLELQP